MYRLDAITTVLVHMGLMDHTVLMDHTALQVVTTIVLEATVPMEVLVQAAVGVLHVVLHDTVHMVLQVATIIAPAVMDQMAQMDQTDLLAATTIAPEVMAPMVPVDLTGQAVDDVDCSVDKLGFDLLKLQLIRPKS